MPNGESRPAPPSLPPRPRAVVLGIVIGAATGLGVSYACYTWLNPLLEARSDWTRELQGFLFTSVLFATLFGAAAGWWIASRISRS